MTDDRIADLERLAYGSGASDDERERAARELYELRASAARASAAEADAAESATEPSGVDAADAVSTDGADVGGPTAADPRRRVRRVIVAATAALVVGVLAGWQLGVREAEQQAELDAASVFPGPRTQAEFLASQPVAAASAAAAVFVRPATDADVPPASMVPDFGNGPLETRLLATRVDGSLVFAGRDDSEVCLVLAMGNDLGGAATCTTDGRFPHEGLSVGWSSSGAVPSLDVTWRPDGSLTMSTAR